jgi:Na+/proline symporter
MAATTAGFLVNWPTAIQMAELWMPIYRSLPNVVSCYQFLETRYSMPVRTLVSLIGNFATLCYISVVLLALGCAESFYNGDPPIITEPPSNQRFNVAAE